MKTFYQISLIALVSLFLCAVSALADSAPPFTLTDITGKQHSLADYAGKIVVLEWFNPGCPYVKKHYKTNNMQSLQSKYTQKGVIWFTVNSSAPGKQGHMSGEEAAKNSSEWQVKASAALVDSDGSVGRKYGARTTPHMFVINQEGAIVYRGAIDSDDSSKESSVAGAKNFVSTALDEVLAGKPVSIPATEPYGCSVKYAS